MPLVLWLARNTLGLLFILWAALAVSPSYSASLQDFQAREYHDGNQTMPYRLFIPATSQSQKTYPLMIFLHGSGEAGTDNQKQMYPVIIGWGDAKVQKDHPCFVLVPQSPTPLWCGCPNLKNGNPIAAPTPVWSESALLEILKGLKKEFAIDTNRIYIGGLSSGGLGTWELMVRDPKPWAAAVPLSASGDTAHPEALCNLPIWGMNGHNDNVTFPEPHRKNFRALAKACHETLITPLCSIEGNCGDTLSWPSLNLVADTAKHLYSEVPNSGHDFATWNRIGDAPVIRWIFAQSRKEVGTSVLTRFKGQRGSELKPSPRFNSDFWMGRRRESELKFLSRRAIIF